MGTHLEVKVLPRAGHSEQGEAQLQNGDRLWEGSIELAQRWRSIRYEAVQHPKAALIRHGCGIKLSGYALN